jgi:hypothetical protein
MDIRPEDNFANQFHPYSSHEEAEVISIAFACAAAVYDTETQPSLPGFSFDQKDFISPSLGGTAKATSLTVVSRASPSLASHTADSFLPMIVVAVRGTARLADCMTNLNDRSTNIESLLVRTHLPTIFCTPLCLTRFFVGHRGPLGECAGWRACLCSCGIAPQR